MTRRIAWLGLVAALALGAWTNSASAQAQTAAADIKNAQGQSVGTATLTQTAAGVAVSAQVKGLPAGKHGVHLHAVGKCEGPDFASAGGHFNPEAKQHGAQNPAGAHAGDLPNLTVNADGSGAFTATAAKVSLATGVANSLFDADGSAFVIHANEDDEKTDPTGNSGGRIACGVIALSALPKSGGEPDANGSLLFGLLGVSAFALATSLRLRRA